MPGSLVIKQGSPKPRGQLAPIVGTGKGTAALLTCPLRECQFFEKNATRALYVRWGVLQMQTSEQAWTWCSIIYSVHGTIQQERLAKGKSLEEFQGISTRDMESGFKDIQLLAFHSDHHHTRHSPDLYHKVEHQHSGKISAPISSVKKRFCHIVEH